MICQKCHQRPATVFFSQTVNQQTTQAHLCEGCAQEQTRVAGGSNPFSMNPFAAMSDFFNHFMNWEGADNAEVKTDRASAPPAEPQLQCPSCGYQLSTFRQNGRLGCTHCYGAFHNALEPLLSSIHGNIQHLQDAPERRTWEDPSPEPFRRAEPPLVGALREKLKLAVQGEKFEEAARLRDEILKLKGTFDV